MSKQLGSQQRIGFAIGGSATAPSYTLKARAFTPNQNAMYDNVDATLGNRDNRSSKNLTGLDDSSLTFTCPLDAETIPVLIAAGMKVESSTESAPGEGAFTNVLVPRNTDGSNNLTIEGEKLTFFYYKGSAGLYKLENCMVSSINTTIENTSVNAEITVHGERESELTAGDLTTAEAGFNLTATTNFKFGNCTVATDADTAFASPTILNVNTGLSVGFNNNTTQTTRTLSSPSDLVYPIPEYGNFEANFNFEAIIQSKDLYADFLNGVEKAVRVALENVGANAIGTSILKPKISFIYTESQFMVTTPESSGDSNDPLAFSVELDKAVNQESGTESFKIEVVSDTDLSALF